MGTVLVTGGAGFIGSHLCRRLIENNRVICVDNLISGNMKNLSEITKSPGFVFIEHDTTILLDLPEKIDEIYNLACPASPPDYQKYPLETLMVCSAGVKNMLDLAATHQARILHTSTSEVYGDPLEHPQRESYWGHVNPIGKRSCYDEGKRFAESLIVNFREQRSLDSKIVRIFNTYGPMMRAEDGRVVSNFINQAIRGEDLTIYGDGSQTRSFCNISDMVDGLVAMMASDETGPINLGNPIELTVVGLAEKILELTGSSSKVVFKELPSDDPTKRRPDITLARQKLHWNPSVTLDDGLQETIKWFQKQVNA